MGLSELPKNLENGYEIRDFSTKDPSNADKVNQVIRWSVRESMVAISPDSIGSHNFSKAAFINDTDTIIGYGAITHIYSSQIVELGGLVVDETARGQGVASRIVRAVVRSTLESIDPLQIIAFSNTKSAPIFSKLGATQVDNALDLPSEVWKVCHTCRYYDEALASGDMCCGRVYDITNVGLDE